MLFHSALFLFAFLPVVLAGYFLIQKTAGQTLSQIWLLIASFVFYGWWNVVYLPLLLVSMGFTYIIGQRLRVSANRRLLAIAITLHLLLLGYFKYAGFMVGNINLITGAQFPLPEIVLPLAISFFTFQKIAYLVDCYKKKVPEKQDWVGYSLFVSFFPQLIAGPIVHHREIMPQFAKAPGFNGFNLAAGLSMLTLGLFKKIFLADTLDSYATPLFAAAADGQSLHMVEAWLAVLAYTFQIYFDFSGYCDMAMGIGKMFGIRLPANFFSPYKSKNIIEFWRRWHMTLSRFLRDYLYIPLGGNRKGSRRRYLNLFATMLIGGLWHGAQWTFVIWGGLHGLYLVINHFWQKTGVKLPLLVSGAITFIAVVIAWVFFRAADMNTAVSILRSMINISSFNDISFFDSIWARQSPLRHTFTPQKSNLAVPLILLCMFVCFFLPNTIEIMRAGKLITGNLRQFKTRRGMFSHLAWSPRLLWGYMIGFVMTVSILKVVYDPSQVFLYFQF